MSDDEALQRRLRAVERSLTDGDHDVDALRDAGTLTDRVEELESQLADAEHRIAELEASTQALRGYVGNVRSVNEDVEQRADAALAAVDRLEERFEDAPRAASESRNRQASAGAAVRGTVGRQVRDGSRDSRQMDTDSESNGDGGGSNDGGDGDDGGLVARVRRAL